MRKIIATCLGILLLSGASIGTYFGVDTLDNNDTSIESIKPTLKNLGKEKRTYSSLSQGFSLKENYYKTSQNQNIATKYDSESYKSLIEELLLKKTNVQDDDILLIPSYYYDLYVRKEKSLKRVSYKNRVYSSLDYELINSLNFHVLKNAKDKKLLASFVDYIKNSETGRSIINQKMETLVPFFKDLSVLPKSCFNYELLRNGESRLSSLVGYIYSMLSCRDNYGFSGFSISDFISTFLELNPRVVTIGEKPAGYVGDKEFVSLSTAKALSNIEDLQVGDEVTIFEDIRDFLSSLTLDSLDSLSGVTSTIKKNSGGDNSNGDSSSPIDLLKGLIETNNKFSSKTSNTMLAILLGVLGSVSKVYKEAKEKYNYESIIKDGDVLTTIIEKTSQGLSNLVKNLLYDDNNLMKFFLEYTPKNNNQESKKTIDFLIEEYSQKRINNLIDYTNQKPLLEKTKKELAETIDLIISLQSDKATLITLDEYKRYLDLNNRKEVQNIEYLTMINELSIKNTLLVSYKKQLAMLEKGTSLTIEGQNNVKSLKESIFNLELELSRIEVRKTRKEEEIASSNTLLESLITTPTVAKVMEINERLSNTFRVRNSLKNKVLNLENALAKKQGFIEENSVKAEVLKKWRSIDSDDGQLEALKSLPLLESIQLFIDFVSFVAYDAFQSLKLGSYDANKEFQFNEINFCGLDCLDVITPFFKEKGAINVINKLINVFNGIVDKFSSNSLRAAGKFLISSLPSSLFTLLNLDFSFLNIKASFREGINIQQKDVYGLINGFSGGGGGIVGSIVGGIAGGVRNRLKGKSTLLGAIVGGTIGLVAGASAGVSVGSGLAYKYFGDGNLKINKPNSRAIDIILDLKKEYDKNQDISFNLFLDGNTLLKENYIPELNDVYKDLFRMFAFSDKKIQNDVESFNSLNKYENFKGWEIGGEVFKLLVMSPYFWKTLLDRSNYENNWFGNSILKENVKENLKNELLLSKTTLQTFSKTNDLGFINNLYDLQERIIDWFLNAFFPGEKSSFVQSDYDYMNIGYNPSELSLGDLQLLASGFRSLTGSTMDFHWVDYTVNGFNNLDAYLAYEKIDSSVIDLSKEPFFSIRQKIVDAKEDIVIPLYKTPFILVTSIFNKKRNIDEAFLRNYLAK